MEKLEVEIPVSVGDKVYRTNDESNVIEGIIEAVKISADSYIEYTSTREVSPDKYGINISIVVKWPNGGGNKYYKPSDIGTEIFLSKKDLIKHLVSII